MYKKIILFFFVASLIVSCSEFEESVVPGNPALANCQGVFFPSTNKTAIEMEPTEPTELLITIARTDTVNAVEVPIIVTVNDEDVYVVPQTVSFAALEKTTQFKVTFANAGEGVAYKLSLKVEGDEFVNPYGAGVTYLNTSVTRIKWTLTEEPFIFVDPVGIWGYDIEAFGMYVETYYAEVGDAIRYRLKNAYHITYNEPDEDGIYDGYPDEILANCEYAKNYYFDDSEDRYITIEVDENGDVIMYRSLTGLVFDPVDGTVDIGSSDLYLNGSFPWGTLEDDIITFPDESLFVFLSEYGAYTLQPTKIYLTKEAYLADNMKIKDFNDIDTDEIEGEVSEFESKAYGNTWETSLFVAVDIDKENDESEYKNLYYLSDLYAKGFGLAFYYDGKTVKIPANQLTGAKFMNQNIYVSPSETINSSVTTTAKGVTVYTFGLKFHYKDGTFLGEFAETFYYSEDPILYSIDDFCGNFTLTGPSLFGGAAINIAVSIEKGTEANSLVIKGIEFAESVSATFDPVNLVMDIDSQELDDYEEDGEVYYMEFDTYPNGLLSFVKNLKDQIVLSPKSDARGYLIYGENYDDEEDAGYFDGYYNLVFTPSTSKSSSAIKSSASLSLPKVKELKKAPIIEKEKCSQNNFSIQSKESRKEQLKRNAIPIF